MRAAGAIPFARTNLPDFGLRVHTDSALRGLTRNPWRQDVTAGGSSGGEGSALASGMSPLGLGNDIGGSLRNPAHCCGIASIKPSTGVVPHASSLPPVEQTIMFQLMAVEGVMARRVADVRAGLLAVAGPHVRDPLALPVELAEPSPGAVLRVAVLAEPPGCDTDPGIAAAIRATAELLAAAGHIVERGRPGQLRAHRRHLERPADHRPARPAPAARLGDGRGRADVPRLRHDRHAGVRHRGVTHLHLERNAADLEWHAFLTDWDVLLTPTWTQPPFRHGADLASAEGALAVLQQLRPVLPANLLGLPAAVVPCAVVDGLPVGAQFTARRFADLTALTAAQAVEDVVGTVHADRPRARVTPRLVAIDLPGGPPFVEALRDVWDAGDAAFPVDQRLPRPAKAALLASMGAGAVVEPGDATARRRWTAACPSSPATPSSWPPAARPAPRRASC